MLDNYIASIFVIGALLALGFVAEGILKVRDRFISEEDK